MANRQKRPPSNRRKERRPPPVFPDLLQLLPREWRRSPAFQHFRTAQVEFLTGLQLLVHDCLERMKISEERERELRRIEVK